MAETYCGKLCDNCTQKEVLSCPGCKDGPGRRFGGECTLAQCCRDKGHQECATCGFTRSCGTYRSKDRMPEYHLQRIEAERIRTAAIAERAPILGKWLWIVFWLVIPGTIASFLTNKNIGGSVPSLFTVGQVINAVCSLIYGVAFIRLSFLEERYRTAGLCALISGMLSGLIAYISGGPEAPTWTLVLSIPAAVVSFVGEYHAYTAHSEVLTGVDYVLSDRWLALWKWYLGINLALLGSILVIIIIPILGLLVTFGAAIGVVVVSVLKLVYLYRTAKLFREYPAI